MFLSRVQSFAVTAVFAMAGAVVFAGDAQPQAGASAQQTQPASARPAEAQDGRQAPVFVAPTFAPVPASAPAPGVTEISPGKLVFPVEQVTGFDVGRPAAGGNAPPSGAPQNRVLPSNVDNAVHALPGAAAYSLNWLVEGVARIEADERRQRAGTARDGRTGGGIDGGIGDGVAIDPLTGKPEPDGTRNVRPNIRGADADTDTGTGAGAGAAGKSAASRKSAAAAAANDPLVQYLQKWMETSSGAAAAVIASQSSDPGSGDAQQQAATLAGATGADSAVTGGAPAAASRTAGSAYIAAQMTQPMLEATGPSIVRLPPPPISPQGDAARQADMATAPAAEPQTQTMPGVPENTILKLRPVEQNPEPAKPLVNDKKYFPQLQRF
ncbi:MAG: hypothetical protein LBM04_06250 [Opitutaceae bacterium]|nr:hypothetical protein [Opitutaceae bacterium]